MARTELTLQTTIRTGLEPAYVAATADGEGFDNTSQRAFIHVVNAGGGGVVVSFDTPGTVDGLAIPPLDVTVPAGEERIIGPFPRNVYNQDDSAGDTGLDEAVFIDTDTQTGITIAAFLLGTAGY